METEIRYLKKEDTEAMFKLACYAFNKEASIDKRERFARLVEHSNNYGLFVNGKLASQVMCTPFVVDFHGQTYQMGGIGYVSSYPEYRGQGKINDMMRQIISDMKNQGLALSYLAPFSYSFYRRFGYEQIFENIRYELCAQHLPKIKEIKGYVRRMKLKEAENYLKILYAKDKNNHRGGIVRADWWWNYYVFTKNKNRDYAVYFNEKNEPEGYIIYERGVGVFSLLEWNYLTYDAFKCLGKFITSHSSAFEKFIYITPHTEQAIELLTQEIKSTAQITPFMMARIVDLELFLNQYPYVKIHGNHTFLLSVKDDYAPWNEGIFEYRIDENGAAIKKISDNPEDANGQENLLKGNIQAFTQLFMGFRRPKTLAFYQRLSGKESVVRELEEIIPRGLPSLVDYF